MKPPIPVAQRLWRRVDRSGPLWNGTPCWLWQGYVGKRGYGEIGADGGGKRQVLVHRVAYELCRGAIPAGLVIDHLCRNRICVNPDHLEPVTHRVNILRGIHPPAMYAKRDSCKRGHAYAEANTFLYRGYRCCRQCNREKQATRRQKDRHNAP